MSKCDDSPPFPAVVATSKIHFAYGSNLGKAQMDRRCTDHKRIGRATLHGYRWLINKRGFANVVNSTNDVVEGYLYEISRKDEESLDRCEGVNQGSYAKHYLDVIFNGKTLSVMLYIDPRIEEGVAKPEYVERINAGIIDAELPLDYVQKYIRKYIKA